MTESIELFFDFNMMLRFVRIGVGKKTAKYNVATQKLKEEFNI